MTNTEVVHIESIKEFLSKVSMKQAISLTSGPPVRDKTLATDVLRIYQNNERSYLCV